MFIGQSEIFERLDRNGSSTIMLFPLISPTDQLMEVKLDLASSRDVVIDVCSHCCIVALSEVCAVNERERFLLEEMTQDGE
jgi:hypothetical protein